MKTTSTTSPKVMKQTSTATKRSASKLKKEGKIISEITAEIREDLIEVPTLRKIPVEQVKSWKPQGECTTTNYWKWACIAILLGLGVGMILSTPTIISLFDACTL